MRGAALLLAVALGACKRQAPMPPPLVDRVEAGLQKLHPGATVKRIDASNLQVTTDAGTHSLNLDNLTRQCTSRPDRCDEAIGVTLRNSQTLFQALGAVRREQVRACLKGPAWLEPVRRRLAAQDARPADYPLTRPWLGDISIVYMVDLPESVTVLRGEQREQLKLDDQATDALARENLEAALPQPTLAEIGGYEGIFAIYEGDDYCTSQLLFPQRFAPLAKRLGGRLVIAAPVRNALLATGRSDEKTLAELKKLAEETAAAQPHPLSTALLRWSPQGFTLLDAP
jgi:hypothetical protein